MNFQFSEELKMIALSARDFAEQYIRPHIMDWDQRQHFPREVLEKAGEMGFMGIFIPEKYGGSGLGYHEYVTIIKEISKVDPSIGLSVAAHNSLCTGHIFYFGNEAQKQKWLPKLATGEWIGAWGLTEHNTGSDAGGMNTTAVKVNDQNLKLLNAQLETLRQQRDELLQIQNAARNAFEGATQKGIAELIKGEESSIKDAMLKIAKATLSAIADTLAKQLTERVTGILFGTPEQKIKNAMILRVSIAYQRSNFGSEVGLVLI